MSLTNIRVVVTHLNTTYKLLSVSLDREGGLRFGVKLAAEWRDDPRSTIKTDKIRSSQISVHSSHKSRTSNLITHTNVLASGRKERSQTATDALKVYDRFCYIYSRIVPGFNSEHETDDGTLPSVSIGNVTLEPDNMFGPEYDQSALFVSVFASRVSNKFVDLKSKRYSLTNFALGNFSIAVVSSVLPAPPLAHGTYFTINTDKDDTSLETQLTKMGLGQMEVLGWCDERLLDHLDIFVDLALELAPEAKSKIPREKMIQWLFDRAAPLNQNWEK